MRWTFDGTLRMILEGFPARLEYCSKVQGKQSTRSLAVHH